MKLVLLLIVLSIFSFVVFLIVFIWGLVKKLAMVKKIAVALFFVFVVLIITTAFVFLNKSYHTISNGLKPRSGLEIYAALFEGNPDACVQVLNARDQIIPKLDDAIYLEVQVCPDELQRLTRLHKYQLERKAVKNLDLNEPLDWFTVKDWGDSVRVYSYTSDDERNSQTLYCNSDSTHVLIKDLFD